MVLLLASCSDELLLSQIILRAQDMWEAAGETIEKMVKYFIVIYFCDAICTYMV